MRPHTFTPDVTLPGNYKGERTCMACHLPERNAVHRPPIEDDSDRILGESSFGDGDTTPSPPTSSTETH